MVNDQDYDFGGSHKFEYDQNRMEFQFVTNAFRHQGDLIYKYQLEGLSGNWQETTFENNSVKYSSLPHGDYTFKVKAINENDISSEILMYNFSISQPFWKTWWFFLLFTFLGASSTILFFVMTTRRLKQRTELKNQIKSSEITAIKAQMNPHFMFNALNSVQDLIMQKDIRGSNIYLGKFADLMRKTLEISSENYIPLCEEVEILGLYLDLEKLRFGDEFTSVINCTFSSERRLELQVPAMLLQPYVENAIKHGLLHKSGKKEVVISFFEHESRLICEIVDNGVGRKKTAEINQRREKSHRSFSTNANKKRIDLIRESTGQDISLDIIDLYEGDVAIGTKVVFKFQLTER